MARSWDDSRNDHQFAYVLESPVQNQEQQTAIACRLCDEMFFDNRALLYHFQSHFRPDGTFNPNSLVRKPRLPDTELKLYSTSSQSDRSFPVPANASNHTAIQNIGIRSALSFRNPVVSGPPQIPVQPRRPTFTHRYHPYQLPSISRSAVGIGSSCSAPNGPLRFYPSIGPKISDLFNLKFMEGSTTTRFPMNPGSSASLDLSLSLSVGSFASQIPSTSLGKRPTTALGNDPEDPFAHYKKPLIMQLNKPIEKMADHVGAGGGENSEDELDLNLKL